MLTVYTVPSHRSLRVVFVPTPGVTERAATLKQRLADAGYPVMPSVTHIVPVKVGDPVLCKRITDRLLEIVPTNPIAALADGDVLAID